MKAQTAAIKYAYMMSLCIATGDDPEADGKTDENTDTPKQGKTAAKKAVNKNDIDKQEDAVICVGCGEVITSERVVKYSMDKYGQPLCMDCQKHASKAA